MSAAPSIAALERQALGVYALVAALAALVILSL
jgi:hypothetical protein